MNEPLAPPAVAEVELADMQVERMGTLPSFPDPAAGEQPHGPPTLPSNNTAGSQYAVGDKTDKIMQRHFPHDVEDSGIMAKFNPLYVQFMTLVILVNCAQIGAECQWTREDPTWPWLAPIYATMDYVFLSLFILETVYKMRVLGTEEYFFNPIIGSGNILDFVLTGVMLAEVATGLDQLLAFRSVRVLRLIRILRVLQTVPELTTVVEGLIQSLSTIAWVFLMLAGAIYFGAIFFHLTAEDLDWGADAPEGGYFRDLRTGMMTMINVSVFDLWGDILDPLKEQAIYLVPFFLFFILLTAFGIVNVIIGVIVDATADTKTKFKWAEKRGYLKNAGLKWEETIHSQGLSQAHLQNLSGKALDDALERRQGALNGVIDDIIQTGEIVFPAGMAAEDILIMLDVEGDGKVSHEEFMVSMGNLLLGDAFQHTLMILANQGGTRVRLFSMKDDMGQLLANQNKLKSALQRIDTTVDQITDIVSKK